MYLYYAFKIKEIIQIICIFFPGEKIKDARFLITVLVCTSMIEVSSARWAKNQVETIQNHHYKTAVAQGTFYTNIQKVLIYKIIFHLRMSMSIIPS